MNPPSLAADHLAGLSPAQQQALARHLLSQWTTWKASRTALESTWQACWNAYLCRRPEPVSHDPESRDAMRSQIVRPVLYEAVETIHSQLLNALFAKKLSS